MHAFDITGKTAFVTGANRGIGRAITERFIADGAEKVYAAVRDMESAAPLVEQFGGRVVRVEFDLTRPALIEAAAERASDAEVVVNNAGVMRKATPLAPEAIEDLRYEMDVNVYGMMRVAQAFAPILAANGGGAFVQLNSVASMKCFLEFATYCASKAAAYSITQALREQLGAQGTAVFSVHPGPVATDMGRHAGFADMAAPTAVVAEALVEGMRSGTFHIFPDPLAKQAGQVYAGFAENIVEADLGELVKM